MEKFYSIIFIVFLSLIILGDEDPVFEEYNELIDSMDYIFQDFSDYIDNDIIDSIKIVYNKKGFINKHTLYSLIDNKFIADIVYKKINKEEYFLNFSGGIYRKDAFNNETKTFIKTFSNYKNNTIYFLLEKDANENNYFDAYKIGYSYNNFIIGDYRIKTGRGLFADWSNHYYFSSIPFYSNRIEENLSFDEYPAFRGVIFTYKTPFIIPSILVSYNYYDSRIDSNNTVSNILQYNIHDDSLSISRKNNLTEYLAGMILRFKNDLINIAYYYSKYSNNIEYLNNDKNSIIDMFGKINKFSYDIAYSTNDGYAISVAFKKFFSNIHYHTGLLYCNNFYNIHSKFIMNHDSVFSVFSKINIQNPIHLEYSIEYVYENNNSLINRIVFKPLPYLQITYKDILYDDNDYLKIRIKSFNNKNIILFNSFILNSDFGYLCRIDLNLKYKKFIFNNFIYYYNIVNNPFYQYEYKIENIYAIKTIYNGNGIRTGISFSISPLQYLNINFSILFENSDSTNFQSGINLIGQI